MKQLFAVVAILAMACFASIGFAPPAEAQHVYAAGAPHIVRDQVMPGADGSTGLEQVHYELGRLTSSPAEVTVVQPTAVTDVAQTLPAILAAGIFAILLRFAGPFAFVLRVARADQMIEKYAKGIIDEWLDHHPTWRTQGITVDVKNQWIASIATQVINIAPGWLIQFLGGKEAIMQKVRNRMPDIIKDAFPALFAMHYSPDTIANPPPAVSIQPAAHMTASAPAAPQPAAAT